MLDFWRAVAVVLPQKWANPRKHMLTKGVGVYALFRIAADIVRMSRTQEGCDRRAFVTALSDFAGRSIGRRRARSRDSAARAASSRLSSSFVRRERVRYKVVLNG